MKRNWDLLIEELKLSGLSANQFARNHQIPLSSLHTAIKRQKVKANRNQFVEGQVFD